MCRSEEDEETTGAVYCSNLDNLLALCDFVVITCPLTPSTHHLLSHPQFKLMKNSAFLINVGRGKNRFCISLNVLKKQHKPYVLVVYK